MQRVTTGLALAAALSLLATASPSASQETELPPCTVDGASPSMCDGTWFGDADAEIPALTATQDGVTLTLNASFGSTFFVDVASGAATGEWDLSGDWDLEFSLPNFGPAEVASTAAGTISGDAREFGVTAQMTNTGSVKTPLQNQTISNTHPLEGLTVRVTGGTCVEVIGEWSFSWSALAAEVGWVGSDRISGGFTAVRQPGFEQATYDSLVDAFNNDELDTAAIDAAPMSPATRLYFQTLLEWGRFVAARPTPSDESVGQALDLVQRIETAVNDLRNDAACETQLDPASLQRLTGAPARYVESIAERIARGDGDVSAGTLRQVVNAGVRTGLIGAAATTSADRQTAFRNAIGGRIDAIVNRTFEESGGTVSPRTGIDQTTRDQGTLAADLAVDLGWQMTIGGTKAELTSDVEVLIGTRAELIRSRATLLEAE